MLVYKRGKLASFLIIYARLIYVYMNLVLKVGIYVKLRDICPQMTDTTPHSGSRHMIGISLSLTLESFNYKV